MKRAQKNHHERSFSSTLKTVKLYHSKYRYFMKKTGWKKTGIYIMTRSYGILADASGGIVIL